MAGRRGRGAAWTPGLEKRLVKLWNSGLSASLIAGELSRELPGLSRNSIIGKVSRLRDSGRYQVAYAEPRRRRTKNGGPFYCKHCSKRLTRKPKKGYCRTCRERYDDVKRRAIGPRKVNPEMAVHVAPAPGEHALDGLQPAAVVLFTERKAGQCAWPIWPYGVHVSKKLCCGSATGSVEAPYCPHHASRGRRRNQDGH